MCEDQRVQSELVVQLREHSTQGQKAALVTGQGGPAALSRLARQRATGGLCQHHSQSTPFCIQDSLKAPINSNNYRLYVYFFTCFLSAHTHTKSFLLS